MKEKKSLKIARAISDVTQWDLAADTGIHPTTLSHIERGRLVPTEEQKKKIAKALNIPIEDIEFN